MPDPNRDSPLTEIPVSDADHFTLLTPARRELVERIAALGPAFAARSAAIDAEAAFPHQNWADLREAGLLGIAIPIEHGGLGADFVGYALAAEELGRHCASTGLTFNMHVATTLLIGPLADLMALDGPASAFLETRRSTLWSGVIERGDVHSQPFSEGIAAGATAGYNTMAVPADEGYRISGRKIFASSSEASTWHNVLCHVEGDPLLRLMGVAHDDPGMTIEGIWDPLGMRGTDSRNLILDQVYVPEERNWLPPGLFEQIAKRFPYFYLTLSFTYLGMMRAIRDFTGDYLRSGGRRDHPIKQQGWAQMNLIYEQAQALMYRVLAEVAADPSEAQLRRAQAELVSVMEGAPQMASIAVRTCGGRSMLRPSYIEQAYRDARCGATMLPWSVEVCLERLGASGLYDEGER